MKLIIEVTEDYYEFIKNNTLKSVSDITILDGKPYEERPQGRCKTCNYYHPYFEQLTNLPRGDGYCVIARMTPEGMTTINCNDEFGCSDYQKGEADMRGGRE